MLVGANMSEPHIDEFAANFQYKYIYMFMSVVRHAVNHFLLISCVSLRHVLIRLELTMYHCAIATSTWNRRLSTSTRVYIARGGGIMCLFECFRYCQRMGTQWLACARKHSTHGTCTCS